MPQVAPFSILYGPWAWYEAPVAEAFPAINASPAGNWALVGTLGKKSQTEEGITLTPSQNFGSFRPAGTTRKTKIWRIDEDMMVEAVLADMTMETLAKLYNFASVTNTVGPPAHKAFSLAQGPDVALRAGLLRADFSPYADGLKMQIEIYAMRLSVNGPTQAMRDDVHKVPVQAECIEDGSGNWVVIRAGY